MKLPDARRPVRADLFQQGEMQAQMVEGIAALGSAREVFPDQCFTLFEHFVIFRMKFDNL
jgi:hypothetical protein